MNSKRIIPPKLATRILTWLIRDDLAEEVLGDLEEKFYSLAERKSLFRARLNYWYQVVNYMRPFALTKRERNYDMSSVDIYRNYFKIAVRNLARNKGFSVINVGGLAVGMAVAILIGLWIHDELTYNMYHKDYDRIAQVMQHQTFNNQIYSGPALPIPLYEELKNTYSSDFKYLTITSWAGDHILSYENRVLIKRGNYMDVDAPKLFSVKMIHGSLEGLTENGSILLSESTAKAFFGDKNPVGKPMKIDNKQSVLVTGVYEDIPYNANLHRLQFIAPWSLYASSEDWVRKAWNQWDDNSFQIYAQIAEHADEEIVNRKIERSKYDNVSDEEKQYDAKVFLLPMSDWHLYSRFENGVQNRHNQYVWMFGAIGVFVLILACINFMNLSTARSAKRAKEVGIRKSIGSQKSQLVSQFMSESFLVVMLAFILSLFIVWLTIPYFNTLTSKQIAAPFLDPVFWLVGLIFILTTGFVAGSYPAFYLSSFHPVSILKGTFKAGKSSSVFRKVLVVVQFTVSIALIIGTLIIRDQVNYSMNRPLGYDQNGILMIQMKSPDYHGKYEVLRTELKKKGAILEMSESSSPLTGIWSSNSGFDWEGKDSSLQDDFATIWVSHDYGKTVNWNIVQGRDFSRDFATDSAALIINKSAAKFMNIKDPVGMTIRWGVEEHGKNYKVIGVVDDMLMESPFFAVRQAIYLIGYDKANWIELKLNPKKGIQESIALVQEVFEDLLPGVPFDYQFADQKYAQKFSAEINISSLTGIAAILAIFISCLGLFGLTSFVAEQRTKEIGIRKVLGASIINLWSLLSKEFVALVTVSCLIAAPVAYYVLSSWLEGYEYRTSIQFWVFGIAALSAVVITLITVSFQSIKAALANPIKSLRSE